VTVVLDSSVLIAAHVSRAGACAELYEEILEHHPLVLSGHIVDEVRRKLATKFLMPEVLVTRAADALKRAGRLVEPAVIDDNACRDAGDLPVLGTAVAGNAELLVTVDKELLDLGVFQSIEIIRPGQFWERSQRS
jgi:putative PIN family toxin of toxin-antitoxin system